MQSLANRHTDRARRIADNSAERGKYGDPALSVGSAALAYRQFAEQAYRLKNDDRLVAELDEAIAGIDAEFAGGARSLAEAPDGSGRTMAGIGVVNPAVVPMAALAKSDEGKGASTGNDPAWGEIAPVTVDNLPESELDPAKGNLNGQALTEQLGEAGADGGWGTTGSPKSSDLDANKGNGGGSETEAK